MSAGLWYNRYEPPEAFRQRIVATISKLFQFQIKDEIKAARIEATKAYRQYVEEPKTSQRRQRLDLELELPVLDREESIGWDQVGHIISGKPRLESELFQNMKNLHPGPRSLPAVLELSTAALRRHISRAFVMEPSWSDLLLSGNTADRTGGYPLADHGSYSGSGQILYPFA